MNDRQSDRWVLGLADHGVELVNAGGKAASLSRLLRAGIPVPDGFCVTTEAYAEAVARAGLGPAILEAVRDADPADPATLTVAEHRIGDLFERALPVDGSQPSAAGSEASDHANGPTAHPDGPTAEIDRRIREAYAALARAHGDGERNPAVAVRSSATAEDLPDHSFAGQQETYLNISGADAVVAAVHRCWASLWTARAIGYRARVGIEPSEVRLAVVVQLLVPAESAGVLFTADPVTGAADGVLLNASWGLGEAVVGGQVTADTLVVDRRSGQVRSEQVGHKTVRTVRVAGGTREEPVPAALRDQAVLTAEAASELAELGVRVEELYGTPMDIEWVWYDGAPTIVQARPITTMNGSAAPEQGGSADPQGVAAGPRTDGSGRQLEVWNDSLGHDFLWTSANVGEAVPNVMTPATWSLLDRYISVIKPGNRISEARQFGNIGGRWYMNLSVMVGLGSNFETLSEQVTGNLPPELEIPRMPIARGRYVRRVLPLALPMLAGAVRRMRGLGRRLADSPAQQSEVIERIRNARTAADLAGLWASVDRAMYEVSMLFQASVLRGAAELLLFRPWLRKLGVSDTDINALATGASDGAESGNGQHTSVGPLASLGPLIGLAQLARGEIDREVFVRRWGHRCPDEFELSVPRPGEDPAWLNHQLRQMETARSNVHDLLAGQQVARDAAMARFAERHPRKLTELRKRMRRSNVSFRYREAGRSEWVRGFWMLREFVLRAGELTGQGEAMFMLSYDEMLTVLRGDRAPLELVEVRRATYQHYRTLPAYPAFIRGEFDPDAWAADPNRRADLYDQFRDLTPMGETITGSPGATGVVEGVARVVGSAPEGEALRDGEVLVTSVTNVGWTPLFPRAIAVVTDIGAPLSHAAIVARELGIPAVVGCATATSLIRTGDRIRVDGANGTVEILESADRSEAV